MSERPRYRPHWRTTAMQLALIVVLFTAGFLILLEVAPFIYESHRVMDTRYRYREGKISKQHATEILGADDPVFLEK